jgi:hypothetical protein
VQIPVGQPAKKRYFCVQPEQLLDSVPVAAYLSCGVRGINVLYFQK